MLLTFSLNILILRQTGDFEQQFTEESDLLEEREEVELSTEKTVVTSNCVQAGSNSWPGEDSRMEIFMEEENLLFTPHCDIKES